MTRRVRFAALATAALLSASSLAITVGSPPADARVGTGSGWQDVTDPDGPPAADAGSPMAHDDGLGETVLVAASTTWTRDSASGEWTDADPVHQPTSVSAVAYDENLAAVVAVGGDGDGARGGLLETWAWDGADWVQLATPTSPTWRLGTTIAFDPDHDQLVLFGGQTGRLYSGSNPNYLADTWTFDGTTWQQQAPATSPTARSLASMTADRTRHEVLLVGGLNDDTFRTLVPTPVSTEPLVDSWVWNGATWTERVTSSGPVFRHRAALAWSGADGQTYLFGGRALSYRFRFDLTTSALPVETWRWDGNGWTRIRSDSGPWTAAASSATYDPDRGVLLLSNRPYSPAIEGSTWERSHAVTVGVPGYRLVAADGGVFTFGDATFHGSAGSLPLNQPVVGMAASPSGNGYWLVAADGGIFSYGDARFHGSMGGTRLNQPVVGMAATPSGNGYWLVASDGGIFAFGDAAFYGSTGSLALNQPVVGMAATPSGGGYWLVARDGGIFSYGDARFLGSLLSVSQAAGNDVVGMAASPSGNGYWISRATGFTMATGDAARQTGGVVLVALDGIVGIAPTTFGYGVWGVSGSGLVILSGEAAHVGDLSAVALNSPIVGIAAT